MDSLASETGDYGPYVYASHPDNLYEASETVIGKVLKHKVSNVVSSAKSSLVIGYIASLTFPAIIPRLRSIAFGQTIVFIPTQDSDSEKALLVRSIQEQIKF